MKRSAAASHSRFPASSTGGPKATRPSRPSSRARARRRVLLLAAAHRLEGPGQVLEPGQGLQQQGRALAGHQAVHAQEARPGPAV